MDSVGLRELKNRLAEYVNRVKAGQPLLVTDRGQPVAQLRPIRRTGDSGEPRLSLEDLVRSGLMTRGKRNSAKLYPSLSRIGRRGSSELLDEERGDR